MKFLYNPTMWYVILGLNSVSLFLNVLAGNPLGTMVGAIGLCASLWGLSNCKNG